MLTARNLFIPLYTNNSILDTRLDPVMKEERGNKYSSLELKLL